MPNHRTREQLRNLVWALTAALSVTLVQAQVVSNVDMLAMFGGRIIGGARACGINAERIRKASEKLLLLVRSKADSEAEQAAAAKIFSSTQQVGTDDVRAEKTRCAEIHVELSEIEVKLAKYPGGDSEAIAARRARRPVLPLGALRPGIGDATAKP